MIVEYIRYKLSKHTSGSYEGDLRRLRGGLSSGFLVS